MTSIYEVFLNCAWNEALTISINVSYNYIFQILPFYGKINIKFGKINVRFTILTFTMLQTQIFITV